MVVTGPGSSGDATCATGERTGTNGFEGDGVRQSVRGDDRDGDLGTAMVVAVVDGTLEVTPPGSKVGFLTNENRGVEIPRGSLIRTGS